MARSGCTIVSVKSLAQCLIDVVMPAHNALAMSQRTLQSTLSKAENRTCECIQEVILQIQFLLSYSIVEY